MLANPPAPPVVSLHSRRSDELSKTAPAGRIGGAGEPTHGASATERASPMPVASPGGFMGSTAPAGSLPKLPAYYEYLAPSRWKDGKLSKDQVKATADRLFNDSLQRNARKHERANRPLPRSRFCGKTSTKDERDARFDDLAEDADRMVAANFDEVLGRRIRRHRRGRHERAPRQAPHHRIRRHRRGRRAPREAQHR